MENVDRFIEECSINRSGDKVVTNNIFKYVVADNLIIITDYSSKDIIEEIDEYEYFS